MGAYRSHRGGYCLQMQPSFIQFKLEAESTRDGILRRRKKCSPDESKWASYDRFLKTTYYSGLASEKKGNSIPKRQCAQVLNIIFLVPILSIYPRWEMEIHHIIYHIIIITNNKPAPYAPYKLVVTLFNYLDQHICLCLPGAGAYISTKSHIPLVESDLAAQRSLLRRSEGYSSIRRGARDQGERALLFLNQSSLTNRQIHKSRYDPHSDIQSVETAAYDV